MSNYKNMMSSNIKYRIFTWSVILSLLIWIVIATIIYIIFPLGKHITIPDGFEFICWFNQISFCYLSILPFIFLFIFIYYKIKKKKDHYKGFLLSFIYSLVLFLVFFILFNCTNIIF
jgi:hypothetical protein